MEKKVKYPRIAYRINYCSSEDPQYPAAELLLQSPECKGWQTVRYCSYPIVLVLEAMEPVRLRQITVLAHQHKIPTRIEIEHRLGNDQPFKRLGHFSMSSNEQTNFSVRELKNVPVDISCSFLKLTLYKNHSNKFNVFNQVGLISVCMFGEKLQLSAMSQPDQQTQEYAGKQQQVDFDKNTMSKLKELETAKRRAVEQEDYEQAKEIKSQIDLLKKMGNKLAELEQSKRIAVQREDYESAKIIQMEIKKILSGGGSVQQPARQAPQQHHQPPQHQQQHYQPQTNPQKESQKYRQPEQQRGNYQQEMASVSPVTRVQKKPPPKREEPRQQLENPDDRPINGAKTNEYQIAEPQQDEQQVRQQSEAEPLKGELKKIADQYDRFFHEELFRKIFSKNFANREAGLEQVKGIIAGPLHPDKPGMVAATLTIVKYALEDKVVGIILSGMDLFEVLIKKYKPTTDNSGNLEPILQRLFDCLAHNSDKVKKVANEMLAEMPNFQLTNKTICIKNLMANQGKKAPPPKTLFARMEALSFLVENYKAGNLAEECVQYAVKYVDDKSNEVRISSMGLISRLVREIGYNRVQPFLKNLRAPIIKSIEGMVQEEVQSVRQDVPIPAARRQQQQPKYQDQQPPSPKNNKKQSKQSQQRNEPPPKPKENVQEMCEFCKKYDPNFINDNYRDLHLFNACPMLVKCECGQALEVSALTSHLLSECNNSKYYKRCPRCKEAIHQRNYRAHTEAKECNPAKPLAAAGRCPLCHQDIDHGEDGWRKHLAVEGCPNHNRGS